MLFVIIPVFNGWSQTRRCLEDLRESRYTAFRTVVVDHGSTDGTAAHLDRSYPEVTRIAASPELWWSGATNVGIRHALERRADPIMLLNNDCRVPAEMIERLLHHMASLPVRLAVVAPLARDGVSGRIRHTHTTTALTLGFPVLELPWPAWDNPRYLPLRKSRIIMGGRGVVIPREVFERVGMMDEENLPHYWADHDFYHRCRRAGIPLFLATDVTVEVDASRTTLATGLDRMTWPQFLESLHSQRSHRNWRSLSAFFRRHYPVPALFFVGVFLNLGRYGLTYLLARIAHWSRLDQVLR
ncbi:MAG: glycosyltransferase [Magnetococcales bacterium]|nr:glycosyltransferase [Magnetococcales bacterium]